MCLPGIVGRLQGNDSFDKGNHYYINTLGEVRNYTNRQHQTLTRYTYIYIHTHDFKNSFRETSAKVAAKGKHFYAKFLTFGRSQISVMLNNRRDAFAMLKPMSCMCLASAI